MSTAVAARHGPGPPAGAANFGVSPAVAVLAEASPVYYPVEVVAGRGAADAAKSLDTVDASVDEGIDQPDHHERDF